MLIGSPAGRAANDNNGSQDEKRMIEIGLKISPVHLNMAGKDPDMVGLGSYLVNAVGDCDGCHTSGGPPNFNYANGNNPYFNQHPAKIDPNTYLGGGADFGPAIPPMTPGQYVGPDIIVRNLTPDKIGLATGTAEGHNTLAQFLQIIKTGVDLDHVHPTCTILSPPTPANCIPAPVDGNLLQIMPWPIFANMTDRQLTAIYTYLTAIPCVEGGPGEPSPRCH